MTSLLIGLALTANGLLFLALPVLSRRHIFFSVTVPPGFRDAPLARATLRRYRIAMVCVTAIAVVVFLGAPSVETQMPAPLLQWVVAMGAWVRARRRVLPHATAAPSVRAASLAPRDLRLPGGVLAACGPFVVLAAAALFLHLNWDRIPDSVPTHWNGSGAPNRWTTKTVASVYTPLLFGVALAGLMLVQTLAVLRRTRQVAAEGPAADWELRFKKRNALYGVAPEGHLPIVIADEQGSVGLFTGCGPEHFNDNAYGRISRPACWSR